MSMIVKIGDLLDIQFGPYEKASEAGEAIYLLGGHFDDDYQFKNDESSYVDLNEKNTKVLLQKNDVVLAGKGNRLFAWSYKEEFGNIIPSSLFFVLRAKNNDVLGDYLAYYINSDKFQYDLKLISAGATLPSIPKKELQELSIDLPSLSEQTKIVTFFNLIDHNIELTTELLEKKKALKKGLINNIIIEKKTNI
jgi:restriction endonuclease S subunit